MSTILKFQINDVFHRIFAMTFEILEQNRSILILWFKNQPSSTYEAAMFFALKQPLGSTYSKIDRSKFSPTGFGHE